MPDEPISKPFAQGLPLHTRSLTIAITRESPTRWRARGDILDLRKTGFVPTGYAIQPSGIIHMMSIDVGFDPSTLVMDEIDVQQPFVAIEPSAATGGECCRDPAPRLLELRGEALDPGFTKRLSAHFGGVLGCSHLLTLFQLMASTIPRAVSLENARRDRDGGDPPPGERFYRRSLFVDGYRRNANAIDVTIQLADTHTRPVESTASTSERLESFHEWKTFATVDRKRFVIEHLEARERLRRLESLSDAPWHAHDERLADLVGVPIIPGLAARLFGLLRGQVDFEPLLDNLLQLAPGFIQITAALMDEYFDQPVSGPNDAREKPAVASIGGTSNSCYMWREDSPVRRS